MNAPNSHSKKNRSIALGLLMVVVGMVALAYASVPLYRLFCQVTGIAGTTQQAAAAPEEIVARTVAVRFNTDTSEDLPWEFYPLQKEVTVRLGEEVTVNFEAINRGDATVIGTSVYNVTPLKVGSYFNKIQCFCFNEQALAPGEKKQFPVTFFVDPELANDVDMDDIRTITLSYTFFRAKEDE